MYDKLSMPNVVHNLGLELPIFDDAQMVWGNLEQSRIPESDDFVREITVSSTAMALQLKKALALTAIEFNKISNECEAQIVPHEWGLLPLSPEDAWDGHKGTHSDIPGYKLVAKVARLTVHQWSQDDARLATIQVGTEHYSKRPATFADGWKIEDMSPRQFVLAQTKGAEETTPFLTDIDVFLWKR